MAEMYHLVQGDVYRPSQSRIDQIGITYAGITAAIFGDHGEILGHNMRFTNA